MLPQICIIEHKLHAVFANRNNDYTDYSNLFISMLPIIELRAGLPYGIAFGMDYPVALAAAVLGNLLPVPFVIVFIRRIFAWLRRMLPKCDAFIAKL